jgi:sortase A
LPVWRKRRKPPVPPEDDNQHLLDALLNTDLPDQDFLDRPVVLRSEEQQRRIAFRPFLLRTWFDYALQHIERILLLAVLAFFAYWLIDGYGRDWWYYQVQGAPLPAPLAVPAPTDMVPVAATPLPTVVPDAVTLPFTTPDMEQRLPAPDFMAPQAFEAPAPVTERDPRPQRLRLPDLSLDIPVVEVFVVDGAWQVADYAAGYHHGTALPGEVGNTVMAGHAGLRGGVFRQLGQLAIGAEIIVEAGGWQYHYRVRERINVWPTQVEVMDATPRPVLTLITCTAWDTQRLVVIADLVDARPLS